MKFDFKISRPGLTVAGIFSLALTSVVLLCGAGYVPVENFAPQGPMQTDLNAGGHSLTNAATVSAASITVSGTLTAGAIAAPIAAANYATYSGFATNATSAGYAASSGTSTFSPSSGTATFATTAGSTGSYTGTKVGTGTAVVLGQADSNGNVVIPSGADSLKVAPSGAIVECFGDSTSAGAGVYGVPFFPGSSGWSYGGNGYSYPQWLSMQPFFYNVPVYVFASGGETSANLVSSLAGSSFYGTEFINGRVIGSIGGVSTSPATLAAAATKCYAAVLIGVNDASTGVSLSAYESNFHSICSTIHGWGANVGLTYCTVTNRSDQAYSNESVAGTIQQYNLFIKASPYFYAYGSLTFSGQPSPGDTVTLGSTTYTFKSSLSGANQVLIGGSEAATIANLAGAINAATLGGQAAGTTYGGGTTANTSAFATAQATTLVAAAVIHGNAIASVASSSACSWGATTLTGAVDGWDNFADVGAAMVNGGYGQTNHGYTSQGIYYSDEVHFTSYGYRIIGQIISQAMTNNAVIVPNAFQAPRTLYVGNPAIASGDGYAYPSSIELDTTFDYENLGGQPKFILYQDTSGNVEGFGAESDGLSIGAGSGGNLDFLVGMNKNNTTATRLGKWYADGGLYIGSSPGDPGNNSLAVSGAMKPAITGTTTAGSSSGTVTWSEPFQGSAFKEVVAQMGGTFAGTATLVLPTAFTSTPVVLNNDAAATAVGTGTIVLTGTGTLPRTAVIEGY